MDSKLLIGVWPTAKKEKIVMENTRATKTTLVLGGTGKTGRRVVERLAARGLPVRVGSRASAPPFDWEDQAMWEPALHDVESVYVIGGAELWRTP